MATIEKLSVKDMEGAAQDSRMDKLVDNLNLTGRKLHELKAILYQESLYTGNDVDTIRWLMLSSRFSKQVRAVDSIRLSSTTDVKALSDITSKKELYHFYETELEDFNVRRGKQDLDSLFNSTINTTIHTSTSALGGDQLGVSNHNHDSIDGGSTSGGADVNDNRTKTSSKSLDLNNSKTSGQAGIKSDLRNPRSDSFEADEHEPDSSRSVKLKDPDPINNNAQKPKTEQAELTIDIFKDDDNNECSGLSKVSREEDRERSLRTYPTPQSHSKKCKVMKFNKREPIRHIQDVFPARQPSPSIISSSSELPAPRFLNRSAMDRSLLSPGSDDSTHLANKSKSANESWYEFKERCSGSSFVADVTHSQSNVSTSASGKSFRLSDYMPKSPSTSQLSKKSVRFSASTARTPPTPRQVHRFDSTESSSDDEVSFDVKQFPCVSPRNQRNRGILRR